MKSRKIKTEISEKLKNVCEELSEKERKGVLVGMLVTSTVLCGITVARAFGRFLSHGTQKELPFVHPVDSLHRADKDSIMYHPKTNEAEEETTVQPENGRALKEEPEKEKKVLTPEEMEKRRKFIVIPAFVLVFLGVMY